MLKARLQVRRDAGAYAGPSRDQITTVLRPEPKTHAPALRNKAPSAILTSHRTSGPYPDGRLLSPSFLDLTPSPGLDSPMSSSEYQSPPTTTSRIKRKGKPPPLILNNSFHSQFPPTLATPIDDVKPTPLTPMTPFTPISPRYRILSEKERFRRRLLKLQRTLGEQITPGLITRPTSTGGRSNDFSTMSTSLNPSYDHFPTAGSMLCAPTDQDLDSYLSRNLSFRHKRKSSTPLPSPSVHYHYLPETVALTPMTLTAFTGSLTPKSITPKSITPKSVTPTDPSFEFVLNCDVQDSSSEDDEYESPAISPFHDSCSISSPESDYRPHSDEANAIIVDTVSYLAPNRNEPDTPNTPGVRRKERRHGWSGEWNQAHIQDVITKLRSL